jgi:hypothetical protein
MDIRKQRELEAKLAKCQDELSIAYKIINEKSEIALNSKDLQSSESKAAQNALKK